LTRGAELLTPELLSCNVAGGELEQPLLWAEEVHVCVGSGTGCELGQACAAKVLPPYEDKVCISREGNAICPAGFTDLERDLFESGVDQRACSACSCDTSDVGCDGGSYKLFVAADCPAGMEVGDAVSNNCINLTPFVNEPPLLASVLPVLATSSGEVCGQSEASGSVVTAGKRRICCKDAP
jgi:hypothetical protein